MSASGVPSVEEITALEAGYTTRGEPSLGEARLALVERWQAGMRDRETALRLAFMDWYACSEPEFLTGLPSLSERDGDRRSYFEDAAGHLLSAHGEEVEVLFVLAVMTESFPWCAGVVDVERVEREGQALWAAYRASPAVLGPSDFEGRGAYGQYFAHMRATYRVPAWTWPDAWILLFVGERTSGTPIAQLVQDRLSVITETEVLEGVGKLTASGLLKLGNRRLAMTASGRGLWDATCRGEFPTIDSLLASLREHPLTEGEPAPHPASAPATTVRWPLHRSGRR